MSKILQVLESIWSNLEIAVVQSWLVHPILVASAGLVVLGLVVMLGRLR